MEKTVENMEQKSRLSQLKVKFRDPVYKNKFICTLFLFWAFIYLGLGAGLGGPSFLDLMLITNTDLDQASTLFTAGAAGYMIGAFVSGMLFDRCNKLMLMAVSILGTAVTTAVKPLCVFLPLMVAMSFLGAFFAAGIDTGGNADLIRLWGREGKSFMQTLHFCFALGGLFAPLILEPFLAPKLLSHANLTSDANNSGLYFGNMTVGGYDTAGLNNSLNETSVAEFNPPTSRILIAYLIVAGVGVSAAIPFFVEFFLRKVDKSRKPDDITARVAQTIPLPAYILTLFQIGAFFFNYCALEETFMAFLTVFTVDGLNWTKADGALVTSVFWGSFAACRFLGIFFINFLAPKKMLILCILLLMTSLCVFLICSIYALGVGIWVSSVGVGFATSIIFPTAFTWIEEHVIKVTGKVTSVIMMSASVANIATPVWLGYLMQKVTYMSFSYVLFVQSGVLFGLYVIMNIYAKYVLRKYHRSTKRSSLTGEADTEAEAHGML